MTSPPRPPVPSPRRPGRVLPLALLGVIVGMVGLSFAAVPLYRAFCAATGFAGTPQIGPAPSTGLGDRVITVRFNADTNPGLPWRFWAERLEAKVRVGEPELAFYRATNRADRPVTGVAVYNVTPEKVGRYFHKTACFCFNAQTLASGQEMQFPVSFWVDRDIATDPDTADVDTITLSYTFFRSLDDAQASGALAKAGAHVGPATP